MAKIQVRRGTAAGWTAANSLLSQGEFGYETDTGKLKIGDGQSNWSALPYFPVEWSALTGAPAVIAAGATEADARAAISAASLDANGKVPIGELPASLMQYQGTVDFSGSVSLADGAGNVGDVYRVTGAGSHDFGSGAIIFDVGDYAILNSSLVWEKSDTTDAVSTVAGRSGDVVLTAADVSGVVADDDPRLSNARTPTEAGQVADMSIIICGAKTTRAQGWGDNPFGVKLQRAVTFTSITLRVATADASGDLRVQFLKNGSTVTQEWWWTIPAADQQLGISGQDVSAATFTGPWSYAAGDVLSFYIAAVGTTPGKGLVADIKGVTA